ncbi:hypothetical protein FS749_006538 [Ceratobasidium sp. UAMH 11750]|nr:hypothetical protein FS749_006538 [Ceratobasidium sp. UAMH 11750]
MAQIDGELQAQDTQRSSGIKLCPAPTSLFTGREGEVEQVVSCISQGDIQRCVFVLHGLGGAGKTQIALKSVEKTRDIWTDIVYVDATSRDTTIKTLGDFAELKQIGDTHEAVIQWLGGRPERWVMVFDNADDPALRIHEFFPAGNHGSILVTTRLPDLALHARGPNPKCGVSGMDPHGAMDLLLGTAQFEGGLSGAEHEAAARLLQDLGYLALAIVHAGAYMQHSRCTVSQYRDLFSKSRERTLTRSSEIMANIQDYQRSPHTTWYMSYERLSDQARQLLWLMAYMHHDGISEAMFRRAAANIQTYESAVPPSNTEAAVYAYVKAHLQSYLDSANSWDSGTFLDVVGELLSYSLISYDRVNSVYTLHVLVHDWAGTVAPHPRAIGVEHTMFLLAVSVGCGDTAEDCIYQRALGVHVQSVLERGIQPAANNAEHFAEVYNRLGRWDRKEAIERIVVDVKRQEISEEHPSTLRSMHRLGQTYDRQGRYEEAENLLSQVLDGQKRAILDGYHPDTLMTMHSLAATYDNRGRYEEAETLYSQVRGIRKQVLGEHHPDTLKTMHNIAVT